MNQQPQITTEHTLDSVTRLRIVRELRQLIAAFDRRDPKVERVGAVAIAKATWVLRDEALKRIDEIESEAPAEPLARAHQAVSRRLAAGE